MPLIRAIGGGALIRAGGGKLAKHAQCCCHNCKDTNCSVGAGPAQVQAIISGVINDTGACDCSQYNGTFILTRELVLSSPRVCGWVYRPSTNPPCVFAAHQLMLGVFEFPGPTYEIQLRWCTPITAPNGACFGSAGTPWFQWANAASGSKPDCSSWSGFALSAFTFESSIPCKFAGGGSSALITAL
jgi:hypothetical protein